MTRLSSFFVSNYIKIQQTNKFSSSFSFIHPTNTSKNILVTHPLTSKMARPRDDESPIPQNPKGYITIDMDIEDGNVNGSESNGLMPQHFDKFDDGHKAMDSNDIVNPLPCDKDLWNFRNSPIVSMNQRSNDDFSFMKKWNVDAIQSKKKNG